MNQPFRDTPIYGTPICSHYLSSYTTTFYRNSSNLVDELYWYLIPPKNHGYNLLERWTTQIAQYLLPMFLGIKSPEKVCVPRKKSLSLPPSPSEGRKVWLRLRASCRSIHQFLRSILVFSQHKFVFCATFFWVPWGIPFYPEHGKLE